jgi:hypothetical protein
MGRNVIQGHEVLTQTPVPEPRFTAATHWCPLLILTVPVLERLTLIEPLQQVTQQVAPGQQGMKIVLIQPFVLEAIYVLIQQTMQCYRSSGLLLEI